MEKLQPFIIPATVTFQVSDAGLIIENAGDVVLHTTFGRPLSRVVSQSGDIELHGAITAGSLVAAGSIRVIGSLTAESIQAGGGITTSQGATLGTLRAGGDVAVGGALVATSIDAGGGLSAQGDVSVEDLKTMGDVNVNGGLNARRAEVAGAVRAKGALGSDSFQAAGAVLVSGAVQVGTVRAGDIEFSGELITARGLQARNAIRLGAGKIQIDAMIANEVHVDARTAGRATIIESQNDLGTNSIKGGFRLADYAEMFGDPAGYLRERGLTAPGEAWVGPTATGRAAPSAPASVAPARSAVPAAADVPVAAAPVAATTPVVAPVTAPTPVAAPASVNVPAPERVSDARATLPREPVLPAAAVSVEAEEIEPEPIEPDEPTPASTAAVHPLHDQLVEAVHKIAERYGESELPPAVARLRDLIDERAYDSVRGEITSIWSDLVKFHQKHGLRIQHQVTTTFNTINSLVKKM